MVPDGTFPYTTGSAGNSTVLHNLPSFCRVVGTIRPTSDSAIGFELWLPDPWNGRYLQSGNGGFAGHINYDGLAPGLRDGFAVASTDDGHTGDDASFALGHPEKLIDYGYRAVHLSSEKAKTIVSTYYGQGQLRSYFSGCSDEWPRSTHGGTAIPGRLRRLARRRARQ